MQVIHIFAIIEESLLAVQFESEKSDEFSLIFNKWNDVEYLEEFFEENKADLQSGFWGDITVAEAVFQTIDEAEEFERFIKKIAEDGKVNSEVSLQEIVFTPLSKNNTSIEHLEMKAYGVDYKSWLRIYAVEIASNLYVVSGGAIKLTKIMNDREHLQKELRKLKLTVEYLKSIGLYEKEDYGFIEIRTYEK
ncbi:hypothetical protein [Aureispira sp. CCB-E]|uniref:hypothetical protein n=1 Tax=Aureispira sp. CCB-E TaxID=3051121 RepID=UPI00286976C5|nr:hypothetical protein [Aureispira sp. CCB-E]WMX16298.1 hypothetical protein QP953_07965 [Aureispira sp. CCB-E]